MYYDAHQVYYDAVKSETEGGQGEQSNPGEWPWSVLIFRFPQNLENYFAFVALNFLIII